MGDLTEIKKGLDEAATGFKQMNKALLIFAGIAAVGLLLAGISLLTSK